MRVSKAAAAESRTRIIDAAARLLRARGVDGASVAEVMQAAGMTHGGFYKHFETKDEMLAEAAVAAFGESIAQFDRRAARAGEAAARAAYIADYLSPAHVARPERGCPVAACGVDAGRRPEALSAAFADGVEALIARFADAEGSREKAINRLLTLVGAVVTARAVGEGALRDELLAAARGER